jgi:hypothetical protein
MKVSKKLFPISVVRRCLPEYIREDMAVLMVI